MLRLLFLCLVVRAADDSSRYDLEGSANLDDDEDVILAKTITEVDREVTANYDQTRGSGEDDVTIIVIIAAVASVALVLAGITAYFLVRRHINSQQQGIYTVPAEQAQKEPI